MLFFGGDGNDSLVAGNYQSILVGGAGDDELVSGNAKDLLAGGAGADVLRGGGHDLLVGRGSAYDAGSDVDNDRDIRAWSALLREWVGGTTLATRQAHIDGSLAGGLNGAFALRRTANALGPATLFSDDSLVADILDGGTGKDWLLHALTQAKRRRRPSRVPRSTCAAIRLELSPMDFQAATRGRHRDADGLYRETDRFRAPNTAWIEGEFRTSSPPDPGRSTSTCPRLPPLSSMGIGLVVWLYNEVTKTGGSFRIVSIRKRVLATLGFSHLDGLLRATSATVLPD